MGTLRCNKHVWGLLSQQAFLAVCLPALAGLWLHSILMGLWVRERWNREGCGEALVVYGWLWCGHGVAIVGYELAILWPRLAFLWALFLY